MRIVKISDGTEVTIGTVLAPGVTLIGIVEGPATDGFSGGPYSGRLSAVNDNGDEMEPFPFQYGLMIVP